MRPVLLTALLAWSFAASGHKVTLCEAEYLWFNNDLVVVGDNLKGHYDRHGKNEPRTGVCDAWKTVAAPPPGGDTPCEAAYRARDPGLANWPNLKDHWLRHGKAEGRPGCPEWGGVVVDPVEFRRANLIYMDDIGPFNAGASSADPNGLPDAAAALAMFSHFKTLPAFVGAIRIAGTGEVYPGSFRELVRLSGYPIDVKAGASVEGASSDLSRAIADASHQGVLHVVSGGPLWALRTAIERDAANASNIILYITRNTWNESVGNGATAYVAARVRQVVQTPRATLYQALGRKGQPFSINGQTDRQWIAKLSANPVWSAANNDSVLLGINAINTSSNEWKSDHFLRLADTQHLARFFGIPDTGVYPYDIVERGFAVMFVP